MGQLPTFTAAADEVSNTITAELAKIELNGNLSDPNFCDVAISTNKMIALGDAAVSPLTKALLNKNVGLKSKWAIARSLSEIGNASAKPSLEEAYNTSFGDNSWLKYEIEQALKLNSGELKRSGKVYVYTIGVQKTRTDCETGKVEVVQ